VAQIRVVSKYAGVEIAEAMRARGYGVTEFPGFGRDGSVEIVQSVVQRGQVDDVLDLNSSHDAEAFVTVEEPKILRGGSMVARDWRIGGAPGQWFRRNRA
jgi:uncharacterized protein YebE (UPF0316 family)